MCDGGEGDAERACVEGQTEGCHPTPARFKRIYRVEFPDDPVAPVRKAAFVDLLAIRDEARIARRGARADGTFRMPFQTIESVEPVDEDHILVVNDNNHPFSTGREPGVPEETEFVLLRAPDLLRGR
jgi:hypothetical protein